MPRFAVAVVVALQILLAGAFAVSCATAASSQKVAEENRVEARLPGPLDKTLNYVCTEWQGDFVCVTAEEYLRIVREARDGADTAPAPGGRTEL